MLKRALAGDPAATDTIDGWQFLPAADATPLIAVTTIGEPAINVYPEELVSPGDMAAASPAPTGLLISVVIPAFNEERTMAEVIARVRRCGLPCEIIAIDDGSTDRTGSVLDELALSGDLRVVHQQSNQGKGAALKLGFLLARGSVVVVQDADLEYDPSQYEGLIRPIVDGQADVVFGSRFPDGRPSNEGVCHFLLNRLLTLLSNVATNLRLSDMETGYKVFRGDLIRGVAPSLQERGFGIEPEITAKIARVRGVRICERPIRYAARGYAQGKKIGWRDGVWTLWCILRYAWV